MTPPLPPDPNETVRIACRDAGANVLFMEWEGDLLVLWMSVEEKVTLRPKMEDLYMEVRRALGNMGSRP